MTFYFPFGLGAAYIALYIFYTTDRKRKENTGTAASAGGETGGNYTFIKKQGPTL